MAAPERHPGACRPEGGLIIVAWSLVAWSRSVDARPADAARLPETNWALQDSEAWTQEERQQLAGLASRLPEALRAPEQTVIFSRGQAPILPDTLDPHLVATFSRSAREIELGLDGLQHSAAAWLAAHPDAGLTASELSGRLLERAVVHALAHRLDRERALSRDPQWAWLSEWRSSRRAAEQDPLMFAEAAGAQSREEDLATTVALLGAPDALPGDLPLHPACRMPSKVAFVERALGFLPDRSACAALSETGLDPERVRHVDLVFVAASVRHPASVAGHMAVVVERDALRGVEREAFSLAAATGEARGLNYLYRGLVGGWPAVISTSSYRRLALEYSEVQDRDLRRYRLTLLPEQEQAVLARLHELQFGWRRPYVFATRNCMNLPLELALAAIPASEPLKMPTLFAADALIGRLYRRGLLHPVEPDSVEEYSLSARAAAAQDLRRQASQQISPSPELARALRQTRARRAASRADGYAAIGALSASLDGPTLDNLDRYLAFSDPIERLALREAGTEAHRQARERAVDALWAAKARVRRDASQAGVDLLGRPDSDALLLAALPPILQEGSAHTPLGQTSLGWAGQLEGEGVTHWLAVRRALYHSEIGEARRFPLAPGLAGTLLAAELQLAPSPPLGVRARGELLSLRQIRGERAVGNGGFYARLLDLDLLWRDRRSLSATWLEGGLVLEPWQANHHRQNLQASIGLAARSRWEEGPDGTGLGLPSQLQLRLSSHRQALTSLDLGARWMPVVAPTQSWHEPSTWARARVRLASPWGVDLAMEGRYEAKAMLSWTGQPVSASQQVQLGLILEPN